MRRRLTLLIALVLLIAGSVAAQNRFRISGGVYAPAGAMTWTQMAAQAGIVSAVEMSSLSDFQSSGFGTTTIIYPDQFSYDPIQNAMKLFIPTTWAAQGLTWQKSLPFASSFDQGQDFWVQFDVRFDAGMLTPSINGDGIKFMSIDEGIDAAGSLAGSCSNNGATYPMYGQIVGHIFSVNRGTIPTFYHVCGAEIAGGYSGLYTYNAAGEIQLQNKHPLCTYPIVNGFGADDCVHFVADTWYTWTVHVKIGTWSTTPVWPPGIPDSQVDVWVGVGGAASTYMHSQRNYGLENANPGNARYGALLLLPYDTNRTSSTVDGNVWYRHVLIGSQPLRDPKTGVVFVPDGSPGNVPPPSTLTASYLGRTGEDFVGPDNQTTPNGITDEHISVAGLRGTPITVRITSLPGAIWQTPYNGSNWIIHTSQAGATADYWFETYPGQSTYHVTVTYADLSTDQATATVPSPPSTFVLTVQKSGTGTVTDPSLVINCGGDCTETLANGASIVLTAVGSGGQTFTGWSGSGCSGTGTCTVTMLSNATVTATFATTTGGGGIFPGLADNRWLPIVPVASSRYICGGNMQVLVTCDSIVASTTPSSREYSGITYGANKLFYFGGGHEGYPGNDIEVYDIATNTWTQSWKPEVCPNIFTTVPDCGAIYGGAEAHAYTALGRMYVAHQFGKNYFHTGNGHFEIDARSVGVFTYDIATQSVSQPAWVTSPSGVNFPWAADIHYQYAFYDPDINDRLIVITASGLPTGVWRQTGGAGSPKYWQVVANIPAAMAGTVLYATYVAPLHKHFLTGEVYATGAHIYFWFDAATMTFTQVTMPSGADTAWEVQYDSHNDRLIAIDHHGTTLALWDCTAVFPTPSCSQITLVGAPPGKNKTDVLSYMPAWQYDDVNNVFWYAMPDYTGGLTPNGMDLQVYRYKN
jgi:hypothetical protein